MFESKKSFAAAGFLKVGGGDGWAVIQVHVAVAVAVANSRKAKILLSSWSIL